jgi:hypothetical protein
MFNDSGWGCKVESVPKVFGSYRRDIVRYCHVLDDIKENAKVAMSGAALARRNADSAVVDLRLEDLEGSIGLIPIDFCQFPLWVGRKRCKRHANAVCRLYENCVWCGMKQCDASVKRRKKLI